MAGRLIICEIPHVLSVQVWDADSKEDLIRKCHHFYEGFTYHEITDMGAAFEFYGNSEDDIPARMLRILKSGQSGFEIRATESDNTEYYASNDPIRPTEYETAIECMESGLNTLLVMTEDEAGKFSYTGHKSVEAETKVKEFLER